MARETACGVSAVIARKQIRISGIVQGIGFRPFIYRIADDFGLSGFVRNTSEGVLIEAEGADVDKFVAAISREHPPFARIDDMQVADLPPGGEPGFRILASEADSAQFVLVSPDLATCDHCRRDFTDPEDRRFAYAFTNCTNCGPRYSIIYDIPYDRPMTTMAGFTMCPECQSEYDDPSSRRFHAQPNACPVCGPQLSVPVEEVRRLLSSGQIVAIKGLGGFHFACDAENDQAVRGLRERKRRSDKPFALMAPSIGIVERFCIVSDEDRRALLSVQRPIVILPRRPGVAISPSVTPNNDTLGVMLPYTPLHHLLFDQSSYRVLVMTSGNLSEEPIVTSNEDTRLGEIADRVVLHNRDICMRVDDSVVRTFEGRTRVLRRSRGYAPYPVDLGYDAGEILACGAELKNTFCLTKGRYALLSQHIGDLENYETLEFFHETLDRMKKLFRVEPRVVAYDLHPGYLSTQFALKQSGVQLVGVQHHHAHIASCMAENRLDGDVIGVAFDGTGYGTDGQIWGGEFLVASLGAFERVAHLRYVPLAGGDQAVREPWRSALGYLMDAFGEELPLLPAVPEQKLRFVQAMIRQRVNTVQTSSCGRLFDAVASLVGLRHETNFEGQAAIDLEQAARGGVEESYPSGIALPEVDMRPAIRSIVEDLQRSVTLGVISARFHNTVASAIVEVCSRIRQNSGLDRVCLSGGTFQNWYLLGRVLSGLRARGFQPFTHSQVPANDGGVSLGQAVVAAATC